MDSYTADLAGRTGEKEPIAALVERSAAVCRDLWPNRPAHASALVELAERLDAQRFHLAVLGQFKRGKSSFLNALLGETLLPTGVVPLTAIPTFIRWAESPCVRVTYRAERAPDELLVDRNAVQSTLFRFVTEEANPKNKLGVARVDLLYPAPLLRQGIVLIDTPGIGSTLRHNTDAALQVLPECDAALLVISPDPPITEAELAYLEQIRPKVVRLFVILNKIDLAAPSDRPTIEGFVTRTLADALAGAPALAAVSATQALAAKQAGDAAALSRSGFERVERELLEFFRTGKQAALREAVARKTAAILALAEMDVALEVRALEMPIEDLEQRRKEFAAALVEIEHEKVVAQDVMRGDQHRLTEKLETQAAEMRRDISRALVARADPVLEEAAADPMAAAMKAVAEAVPDVFDAKLGEVLHAFRADTDALFSRYQRRADELVNQVRRTAANLFDIRWTEAAESEPFSITREPYWVAQRWDDGFLPISEAMIDRLLPRAARTTRLKQRMAGQVEDLVRRNVENLRWATLQSLNDTFRRFGSQLDDRLAASVGTTRDAIEAAVTMRRERSELAEGALERLRNGAEGLRSLRQDIEALGQDEAPSGR